MAKVSGESKLFAFLAYLFGILGFILVFLVKRKDKFAMYHAKQSLVLSLAAIVLKIIAMVPILGWIVFSVGIVIVVVLWVMGVIHALSGEQKPLPIIGVYGEKIKL